MATLLTLPLFGPHTSRRPKNKVTSSHLKLPPQLLRHIMAVNSLLPLLPHPFIQLRHLRHLSPIVAFQFPLRSQKPAQCLLAQSARRLARIQLQWLVFKVLDIPVPQNRILALLLTFNFLNAVVVDVAGVTLFDFLSGVHRGRDLAAGGVEEVGGGGGGAEVGVVVWMLF